MSYRDNTSGTKLLSHQRQQDPYPREYLLLVSIPLAEKTDSFVTYVSKQAGERCPDHAFEARLDASVAGGDAKSVTKVDQDVQIVCV